MEAYLCVDDYGTLTISGTVDIALVFIFEYGSVVVEVQYGGVFIVLGVVFISYISVQHLHGSSTRHHGTFAAAVYVALYGRESGGECRAVGSTDGHVCVALDVAVESATEYLACLSSIDVAMGGDGLFVLFLGNIPSECIGHARHGTGITAAIDVAAYESAE